MQEEQGMEAFCPLAPQQMFRKILPEKPLGLRLTLFSEQFLLHTIQIYLN